MNFEIKPGINLFHCDCMDLMRETPDKFYDLCIVDPPYGIGAGKMTMGSGKHRFTKDKSWDSVTPSSAYWKELFRVSVNQIVWGGNYFTEHLPPSPHWIIWDKNNPNLSFAEGEMAWVRHGNNLRIFQHYSAQVEGNGKIHPTQKPVRLYKWIMSRYAKPGDRILDTHLGSGSSAIAAFDGGFDFVGTEIDVDYYTAAKRRFDYHRMQLKLL